MFCRFGLSHTITNIQAIGRQVDKREFFKNVFRNGKGRVVLVLPNYSGKPTQDHWFSYPEDLTAMVEFAESKRTGDVWYSPIIFKSDERTKKNAKVTSIAGADADSCDPNNFRVQPSLSVETSAGHWHVYWALDTPADANEVAKLNRRIAQSHKHQGCDIAFVNAAKLLRVPGTSNNKHPGDIVIVSDYDPDAEFSLAELNEVYPTSEVPDALDVEQTPLPVGLEGYVEKNRGKLLSGLPNSMGLRELLFGKYHEDKRSDVRFKLLCELYRLGMDDQDVVAIAWGAPSNKYNGDDPRGIAGLWAEAMKAKREVEVELESGDEYDKAVDDVFDEGAKRKAEFNKISNFLSEEEQEQVSGIVNFIDEWTAWAGTKTDAPPEYHRIGAIILLSTVYSQFGYVHPTFGKLKLNIWAMVLGRSTKDRKTTAKTYIERMLRRLTTDEFTYILPDDATPGGLNVALQDRANMSSIITRDEVQGFFDEMQNQSYMAGGISYFTKLYDGWSGGRARASGDKKIAPSVPISFVFFLLGILEDSAESLTIRNYKQGFITRFVYILAERPSDYVEPPIMFSEDEETEETDEVFNGFAKTLSLNRNFWEMRAGDGEMFKLNIEPSAIERFQQFREDVQKAAANTPYAEIIDSTSDRMTLSVLKLAGLLTMHDRGTKITLEHMLQAISYAGEWFDNAVRVASMISESEWRRDVDKLENFINSKGGKVNYNVAYRAFADKRPFEFEEMINALEARGVLERIPNGGRWVLKVNYEEN
jgi:hypothetical protein